MTENVGAVGKTETGGESENYRPMAEIQSIVRTRIDLASANAHMTTQNSTNNRIKFLLRNFHNMIVKVA